MNAPAMRRSESIGYQHCNQPNGIAHASRTRAEIVNVVRASRHLPCGGQERDTMTVNRVILSVVAFALVSAPAMAQGDKALSPAAPPPAAKANEPATTGKATPAAAKVNLNTAPAAELQK